MFEVYTDGACSNNQGKGLQPGGWGAVFVNGKSLSGGEQATTNNRMEMKAVIKALKNTPSGSHVKIYSDSAYIINCFKQNWIGRWENNGWITSSKKPVENKELWMEMRQLEKERKVEWIKVKGHSGNKWNEMADKLAVEAIPKDINKEYEEELVFSLTRKEKDALVNFLQKNKENIDETIENIMNKLSN